MRIVFLLQDVGDVYGAEQATADLALGLSRSTGVDVEFFLIKEERLGLESSHLHSMLAGRGFNISSVPVQGRVSRSLVEALRGCVESREKSILHCVGPKANLHGGWGASWGRRFPVVATVHGWLDRPDLKEKLYTLLERRALRRMSRVIVLSRYYEDKLRQGGVRGDRLVRIPSGFPTGTSIPEEGRGTGSFTVGMLARLSPEKDHDMLLRAAKQLNLENARFRYMLAGEGQERSRIVERAHELDLEGQIELPGYMDRDSFFSVVDVLVLCSRMENLPFSIMEAMARSLPVVATAVGGVPDLIEDGVSGYLVGLGQVDDLARRLLEFAQDPEARSQIGAAGYGKLQAEFSLERCVADHLKLYRGLLEE